MADWIGEEERGRHGSISPRFPNLDDWVDEDVFDRNLKYCRREYSHLERKTFNLAVDICS